VETDVGSQIVSDQHLHLFFGDPPLQPDQKHFLEKDLKFLS
jgi:hypothetical protein